MSSALRGAGLAAINETDVKTAYKRWAPVYDHTFGRFIEAAVRQVAERANDFSGRLSSSGSVVSGAKYDSGMVVILSVAPAGHDGRRATTNTRRNGSTTTPSRTGYG